jgi:uncharacterized protein YigA (DUF484 family)
VKRLAHRVLGRRRHRRGVVNRSSWLLVDSGEAINMQSMLSVPLSQDTSSALLDYVTQLLVLDSHGYLLRVALEPR